MATPSSPLVMDAETVHNWTQCYSSKAWAQDLSADIRADVMRATMRHHRDGTNATEEARQLAEKYPGVFFLRTSA